MKREGLTRVLKLACAAAVQQSMCAVCLLRAVGGASDMAQSCQLGIALHKDSILLARLLASLSREDASVEDSEGAELSEALPH